MLTSLRLYHYTPLSHGHICNIGKNILRSTQPIINTAFVHVRYPAINKPAAVLHWLNHADIDAEFIVILDADMILRGPITPWEFKAARGRPVSTPYE